MSQSFQEIQLRVTLDTNIVMDFLEQRCDPAIFERAKSRVKNSLIKFYVTGRMYADLTSKTKSDDSYARFLKNCEFLENTIPAVFRADSSRTDSDVCDAGGYYKNMHNEIYKTVFPTPPCRQDRIKTSMFDIDHFIAHIRSNNHIFVTNDKPFADDGVRAKLTEKYTTKIMNLTEFDNSILKIYNGSA